jgi:DNA mismatch repair protein MutS
LHLDQIVEAITAGRDEYNLKPFFYTPLADPDIIYYRHEVLRDLENPVLAGHIRSFSQQMHAMREHLAQADKLHYRYQKQSWFLDAVELYCAGVRDLMRDLAASELRSRGLREFREYLAAYMASDGFTALAAATQQLKAGLSGIRYSLHIQGRRIQADRYASEPDYSAEVLQTFEKFKQAAAKEYRFKLPDRADMNHVEAAILDLVAQLYPEIFAALDGYGSRWREYLDGVIAAFDREVQFYLACLEHAGRFRQAGLEFCYPTVTRQSKEVCGHAIFDLALAGKLIPENQPLVTNDFYLEGAERILVISGPNQGGKTTFARAFGQLHYLASIGCPVPARQARLFLIDELFTHFERVEEVRTLNGRLEDELRRIRGILQRATGNSILIMNESFLSTALGDALFVSKAIIDRIIQCDMLCVCVTFLDELSSLGAATVSMVSTVDARDPALRTFRIVRKPADGLAYAAAIAEKYGLTYEKVKGRVAG